jgi:hypothetical protein
MSVLALERQLESILNHAAQFLAVLQQSEWEKKRDAKHTKVVGVKDCSH